MLPVSLCASIGGALVVALAWLAKKNSACEENNERRHQEVVAITREFLQAVADLRAAIQELRHAKD